MVIMGKSSKRFGILIKNEYLIINQIYQNESS